MRRKNLKYTLQHGDTATSRQLATKEVPRVNTSSPASVDAGFVESSYCQVLPSMTLSTIDRQPYEHTDTSVYYFVRELRLYAPSYEQSFLAKRHKDGLASRTDMPHYKHILYVVRRVSSCHMKSHHNEPLGCARCRWIKRKQKTATADVS